MDVYRPITEQTTTTDHRPFRGNIFTQYQTDEDGNFIVDEQGYIKDTVVNPDQIFTEETTRNQIILIT